MNTRTVGEHRSLTSSERDTFREYHLLLCVGRTMWLDGSDMPELFASVSG